MKFTIKLTFLFVIVVASKSQNILNDYDDISYHWDKFKIEHDKNYRTSEEHDLRYEIFQDNFRQIAEHNVRYKSGLETYKVGVNQFTDLTHDEFLRISNCYDESKEEKLTSNSSIDTDIFELEDLMSVPPRTKNWVKEGAVVDVKNQKPECGSCYAFSTLGPLEAQIWKRTGKLIPLSEQQLVDCTTNDGCDGGLMSTCYEYIKKNGIATDKSYQYKASVGRCKRTKRYDMFSSKGSRVLELNGVDENLLKKVVGILGPVTCATNVKSEGFKHYKGGVFYDPYCNKISRTHAMVIVGYGKEAGLDYWLVRNSWGKHWGINGYIKMARNKDNHCGIATKNLIPVINKK